MHRNGEGNSRDTKWLLDSIEEIITMGDASVEPEIANDPAPIAAVWPKIAWRIGGEVSFTLSRMRERRRSLTNVCLYTPSHHTSFRR
jgi:hypothetical protein